MRAAQGYFPMLNGGRRLRPYGPHVRPRGVGPRHIAEESLELRMGNCRRRARREGCGSRRTLSIGHVPDTEWGFCVSHRWRVCGHAVTLGRYSSAIRAACANERSCGSVRGAISDGRPYRDLIDRLECCSDPTSSHFSALEPLPALEWLA